MESVVFEDSPLALYLEGEGKADDDEWTPKDTRTTQPISLLQPSPFAPQGFPARSRRRPSPPLNLDRQWSKGAIARLRGTCSNALDSKLGWVENGRFLEQFRYTIIASQLLNDIYNPGIYKRPTPLEKPEADYLAIEEDAQVAALSWTGLFLTASAAFILVWSIHWTRNAAQSTPSIWSLVLTPVVAFTIFSILYVYFRRQWLHWIRRQAVESASTLVASAQNLDAAVSAAINLVQEVELVYRGYGISSPLSPITRIEGKNQTRRCAKLRGALQRVLVALPESYYRAYEETKMLAVEADLEKYYDIYEISRSEMLEAEEFTDMDAIESSEDTLKTFKTGLQKLYLARKLFCCSLLALSADGGTVDFAKWSTATRIMKDLTIEAGKATQDMDETLGTGEDIPTPIHPKMPLTPGRERIRSQIQKLTSLSQGIRVLQARMHLLRDDADKIAGDTSHLSATMVRRYESIGTDLKELLVEWQEGQVVFSTNMDNSNNRLSLPVPLKTAPSSPTMSLGGSTVVEGSPPDAFRALNGYGSRHRPSSSTATSSCGEEVFEAIALPRQRSTLNREERAAKMKEDRVRQAMAKSKTEATSHMLRELETVIKLRPRGRTTGRIGSI